MKAQAKRLGWATMVALAALATTTPRIGAFMATCANYITSSAYDEPIVGWLIGERGFTQTTTTQYGSSGGWKVFTSSVSRTTVTTISYSIGTYLMSDGSRAELRCDTYRFA